MASKHLFALLLALLAAIPFSTFGQTTFATITGTVSDASGAVIPNATVTVTNTETSIQTSAVSNNNGTYTIPQLKEGKYTLVANAAGFKAFTATEIVVVARDYRRIEVRLDVESVSSSIEVTAGATVIETETARISETKTSDVLKSAPMNARWLWMFLNLTPNVQTSGEGYRIAGSRGNQINWSIDGTGFNDGVGSGVGAQANYVESFQEVKVDLSNNSAEFGAVGQLTVVSKSGTNDVHGAAFDYYKSPVLWARNPFALAKGTGVYHLFGGALSGPVYLPKVYNGKNKTFFYTSFEGSVGGDSTTTFNPSVPLEAWRNGDFSALSTTIYDPLSGQPFDGNKIPANRISAVSKKLQDRFYPLPNYGSTSVFAANNYRENVTRPWDIQKYWMVRGDHHFSDTDFVYGRFTFTRGPNTPFEGNLPTIGRRIQRRDTRSTTFSYTHLFSPAVINEARWGMLLNNNPLEGPVRGRDLVNELGLTGLASNLPDIGGILKLNWSGIGLQPLTQIDYTNPGFRNHGEEFQEHLTWMHGRHTLKFGFDVLRTEWDDLAAGANLFGGVTFSNRFTSLNKAGAVGGHPYADFLLGIPTSASRSPIPLRADRNRWQYDFFAVDDIKLSTKLTLNLGVRYELHTPWRENHGYIAAFDIASASIVVPDLSKISPLFPSSYVPIISAQQAGLPSTLVNMDRNNIAPRIGVAYRPWDQNTVIRAGFGVYYDFMPRDLNMGASPFTLNESAYTNPIANPDVVFPRVFPDTGTAGPSTVSLPAAVNPNIQMPYTLQYSFTIERQQWGNGFRLSYIGTGMRQGDYGYNINSPLPDNQPYISKPRPFQKYSDIIYYTNGGGHQYNSLTAEFTRPMSKGLFFNSFWTWARDIYDVNRTDILENPFDRQREVAVARAVPTHRWVTTGIYNLPFGKGRKWASNSRFADLVVGGWELSAIYTAQTGQFLTPTWQGPDTTGTAFTTSATPANVTRRPDLIRNPNLPDSQQSIYRWFDVGAFGAPQLGRFGNAAKGTIIGPGLNIWNAGLAKTFFITEKMRFRGELTGVNILNHPNWSNPVLNVTQSATAGTISAVGGNQELSGERQLRLGARLEW